MTAPIVSVIVANYNGAAYLAQALRSALNQTLRAIEVIVADDGSTDASRAIATALAAEDPRLRLLPPAPNGGPAAARNRCLDAAQGTWIAVLDNDDLMHPERLETLVAAAERDGADIVADDLILFSDDPADRPRPCLHGRDARAPRTIGTVDYVRANTMFRRRAPLGYLKPLIRRALLGPLRYDPSLRIGEDYDLIARLLIRGARMRIYPLLTYFYRRHPNSISHRLSAAPITALIAANAGFTAQYGTQISADPALGRALAERGDMLRRALEFDALVQSLQHRRWTAALGLAVRHPAAALLLRHPLAAALRRSPTRATSHQGKQAVVISRQRVVGPGSGSGAYLLDLVGSIAALGITPHLVWPSPTMFGRQPVLKLQPEMRRFATIQVRGGIRIGTFVFATTPRPWLLAARGVLGAALARCGIQSPALTRTAPYSIASTFTRADQIFLARHARPHADLILADYAFLTPGIAHILRPDATSLVVMHDLFSSRAAQFGRLGATDTVATIGQEAEMRLLSLADAIIAIQPEEAATVAAELPARIVLVAPMAVQPVAGPQPGTGQDVLFVGSKTAPNLIGLRDFLDHAWPTIHASLPAARLLIAGGAGPAAGTLPPGAIALGYVDDLAPLYRDAAVVIAPLPAGSGLKVKLIEALGHGKAIVASESALQGVAAQAAHAVWRADTPPDFAEAVITLLTDAALRARHATAALGAARTCYSAAACHGALRSYVAGRIGPALHPLTAFARFIPSASVRVEESAP